MRGRSFIRAGVTITPKGNGIVHVDFPKEWTPETARLLICLHEQRALMVQLSQAVTRSGQDFDPSPVVAGRRIKSEVQEMHKLALRKPPGHDGAGVLIEMLEQVGELENVDWAALGAYILEHVERVPYPIVII